MFNDFSLTITLTLKEAYPVTAAAKELDPDSHRTNGASQSLKSNNNLQRSERDLSSCV